MHFKYFINALGAAWILVCSPHVLSAEITYFYDGDTVKVQDAGREYKLRLTDIDAPERNQAYGKKSRRALMRICGNTAVKVYISGIDKYQRNLGSMYCNNLNVSEFMVKNGYAWFNRRYSHDFTLDVAEQTARKNKLGLWKAKQQTPPWVWRKNHPH